MPMQSLVGDLQGGCEESEGDERAEDRLRRARGRRATSAAGSRRIMPPITWSMKKPSITKTATPKRML
ncbi:MAG: hypothetical protein V9F00_17525 [Nocardioides sp.]